MTLLVCPSLAPVSSVLTIISLSKVNFFAIFFNKVSDIWHFCESGVPGPSLHYHAGVRVESAKPTRPHEFLWPAEFPGTLSSLGADGILTSAGQLHHCGSFRYLSLSSAVNV